MASLKIDNDRLENRGDAQTFLREIAQQIGKGYSQGPGWDYNEEVSGEAPEPKNDHSADDSKKVVDKHGEPLEAGDYVFAEQGFENTAGELLDITATILEISKEGDITLHDFTEQYDLKEWTYEGSDLVKREKPQAAKEGETGDEPWNKKHDEGTGTASASTSHGGAS